MHDGEIYQHFRGGLYIIRSFATLESTGQLLAIYENIDDHKVWARPTSEFDDFHESGVKRFERIGEVR